MKATKSLKQLSDKIRRHARIRDRLGELGLEVHFHKHLDRMSNVRWHGGRLQDGTCHYTHRYEWSGTGTYAARTSLKAHGCRWDAARKVWWLPANRIDEINVIAAEIIRKAS